MPLKKPKRVLLLGATFATGNLGVSALAASSIRIIKRTFPDAEVLFLDYGKCPESAQAYVEQKTIPVELINLRFTWKFWLSNNVILMLILAAISSVLPSALRERVLLSNERLWSIAESDLVVALSGGDSFSDIYGLGRFVYVVLPQFVVLLLGLPLIIFPQTIGPFRHRSAQLLSNVILKRSSLVFTRDERAAKKSEQSCGQRNGQDTIKFSHDVAFVLEPRKPSEDCLRRLIPGSPRSRPLVGLNVSGLLMIGGYSGANMFQLATPYEELVLTVIEGFVDEKHCDLLLVPHVIGSDPESDGAAALTIYDKLASRYRSRVKIVDSSLDQHEMKYVISLCEFFIGSRMHACIGAVSQGIPAACIAYSDKFTGVFSSLGFPELVVDPRTLAKEELLTRILELYECRGETSANLQKVLPEVKEGIMTLLLSCDWEENDASH